MATQGGLLVTLAGMAYEFHIHKGKDGGFFSLAATREGTLSRFVGARLTPPSNHAATQSKK